MTQTERPVRGVITCRIYTPSNVKQDTTDFLESVDVYSPVDVIKKFLIPIGFRPMTTGRFKPFG